VLDDVTAERADRPDLDRWAVERPSLRGESEAAGEWLERHPLRERRDEDHEKDGVEDGVAAFDLGRERERREHDRYGAAQARPGKEELLAQAEAERSDGRDHGAAVRRTARP